MRMKIELPGGWQCNAEPRPKGADTRPDLGFVPGFRLQFAALLEALGAEMRSVLEQFTFAI